MKPSHFILPVCAAALLSSCKKEVQTVAVPEPSELSEAVGEDIPLLPVKKDDHWTYQVRFQIPGGAAAPGSEEVDVSHERTRRYLGKISPGEGLPEVDCFEVVVPDSPVTRELVEIRDDRILLRGSSVIDQGEEKVFWQDPAVPFIIAGMDAGVKFPDLQSSGGGRKIHVQVVGREEIAVPAGRFHAIRMLMTGMDGEVEFRRTIWFAPRVGIVREEKTRYSNDKLLVRETHELVATNVSR